MDGMLAKTPLGSLLMLLLLMALHIKGVCHGTIDQASKRTSFPGQLINLI
jgi:hypothetical protein